MATTDDLTLRMRAQGARAASRDVDRTSKSVKGLGRQSNVAFRSFTKLGGGLRGVATGAAAFGVAGVTMAAVLGKQAVTAASDLNEVLSKTQVIFKGSAPGLIRWSTTTADALGLSQEQALAAASGMGNLLVPMGVARKTAAGMSKRMVTLAGDMASFNNASPEETLAALQSAFIGEYDPVQRFGAAITAARVESEAMRKTHKKNAKDLTAAEKAQAAYNLILRDTKDQQGDFNRTSTGLANAQRRLAATWNDLKAAMGAPLLEIVRNGLNRIIGPLQHVTNTARDVFSDKKLNWQQRFRILGASIRHWFGPIATDMVEALKAAHIDQKLNAAIRWASPQISAAFRAVAPAAASAFIAGFKAAPGWAKLLTVAFLLAKLTPALTAGGALAGTAFGAAMGPAAAIALGLALVDYFASEQPGKKAESANPEGVRGHHIIKPGEGPTGAQIYHRRTGDYSDVIAANTAAGKGYQGIPQPAPPVIHTHVHLNKKEIATAVHQAGRQKKSTR